MALSIHYAPDVDDNHRRLCAKAYQIAGLERMGARSAANLVGALNRSKQPELSRLLYALGIREVGEVTARSLARHFRSMQALLAADEDALLEVDDVGPIVAAHVRAFFGEPHNLDVIAALEEAGVQGQSPEESTGPAPLAGQNWVLTGALGMPRIQAKNLLESLGAKVVGSVSRKT